MMRIMLLLPVLSLFAEGKSERVLIPAGSFVKGSNRGADDERPLTKRSLPAFKIDRTEVTRAMYARCVASHHCPQPAIDLGQDAELPVTDVKALGNLVWVLPFYIPFFQD